MKRLGLGVCLSLAMAGNASAGGYGALGLDYMHASSENLHDNLMLNGTLGWSLTDFWGLEGRLGVDFFSLIFDDDPLDDSGAFMDAYVAGYNRFTLPLSNAIRPYALLGWQGASVSVQNCYALAGGCEKNHETHSGFAYGGGVDFRIEKGVYLKTEVTHFEHNEVRFNTFSVGVTGAF
ncbi:outer membrane beta-barrel protein [Hahella sp. HN01]|uniref:outer membrane beta-barrel protein n=1 Tax=Hahella sp. HN01 TaxID=2847262 RepID=UPI0021115B06|nr:outer membrane beta-barrel protein [Hahella sp. HN01]